MLLLIEQRPPTYRVGATAEKVRKTRCATIPTGQSRDLSTQIHVSLNLWPRWMEIAYRHVIAAEKAHGRMMAALQENNDEALDVLVATSAQPPRAPTAELTDLLGSTNNLYQKTLEAWETRRPAYKDECQPSSVSKGIYSRSMTL